MNRSASSTGHLDPCAQEFTPGTYTFYQAAAVQPAAPSMFYSYPLEARPYIQPAPALPATLSSPVLPLYTHPEVAAVPFGSSIPWDNRRLHSQTEMGMQHLGRIPTLQNMTQMGVVPGNRPRKFSTSSSSSTAIGGSGRGYPFVHGREHATRALLLSPVPVELRDSDLRRQLEAWGPIRALDLNKRRDGFVTVLYYDLRHAKNALRDIQQQHLLQQRRLQQHYSRTLSNMENRSSEDVALPPPPPPEPGKGLIGGKAIWAQFAIPVGLPPGPESHNQGTLVVFNLDADIDAGTLRSTFEAFGPVKEVRETPTKRQHKFVEFFDVRDAARALEHVKVIAGKPVKIEFSRPGGLTRRATAARSVPSAATANVAVPPPPPPPPPPLPPPLPGTQFMHNANHVPLPRPPPRWTKAPLWPLSSFNTSPRNTGSMKSTTSFHHHQHYQPTGSSSSSQQQQQQNQSLNTRTDSSAFRRRRPGGPQQHQNPESMLLNRPRQLPKFGHPHRRSAVSQFAFDEAKAEANSSDARTTVMIKNIPNKYSQHMLLTMLDHHCINCNERITDPNEPWSAYDFVYLPIDFKNKCNLGYAFVNWTTSKATWKFYKEFHMQPWEAFNSRKICEVTYARIQGREALMEHFSNSKFACDTDEYLPLVFSPPRDGKQPFSYQAMGSSSKNLSICNPSCSKSAENEGTSSKSKHEAEEGGKDLQEDSTKMSCVIGDSVVTTSNNRNRAQAYQDKGYFSSRRGSGNWSQQHCTQSNGSWSERRRAGDLY